MALLKLDNHALVAASRNGDTGAFTTIVERYQAAVFATAFAVTRDRSLSEDIAQETFVTAWRSLDRLEKPSQLSSWLCGIARNLSKTALRKRRDVVHEFADTRDDQAASALDSIIDREDERIVRESLERMPENLREPLVLYYLQHQSAKDVAEVLSISEDAVNQRLSRGRKHLARSVRRTFETTLDGMRPGKAFVAAVIGIITGGAAASASAANAARSARSGGRFSAPGIAALAAVLLAGGALAVLSLRGSDDRRAGDSVDKTDPTRGPARITSATDPRTVPSGTIAGTVRREDGSAVSAARVCLVGKSIARTHANGGDPQCALADGDGRYSIDGVLAGSYSVYASAPELAAGRYRGPNGDEVRVRSGEEIDGVDIVLSGDAVVVRGTVVDIGGGPIAGAWVRVSPAGWGGNGVTQTDAGGHFETWVQPAQIDVIAGAYGYTWQRVSGSAPGPDVLVRLSPGSVYAGTVVDAKTRQPVPGALVEMERSGSSAYADEQGRFEIRQLSPNRYRATASAPGRYGEASESVLLGVGETVDDVVIEVYDASRVSGRVETAGGQLCQKGNVGLRLRGGFFFDLNGAVEDGEFAIDPIPAGLYSVSVTCDRHVALESYPDLDVAGDRTDLLYRVGGPGAVLTGKILTPSGDPVYSEVSIQSTEPSRRDSHSTRTGPDGSFAFHAISPGSYALRSDSTGHPDPSESTMVEVTLDEPAYVERVVEQGGDVRGVLVDTRGKPVAGVPMRSKRYSNLDGVYTGSDGTFHLVGLHVGEHDIEAMLGRPDALEFMGEHTGYPTVHVVVRAGEVTETRLVIPTRTGTITGQVLDEAGAPITSAYVVAESGSWVSRWDLRSSLLTEMVMTDVEGRFEISGLPDQPHRVLAFRKGGGEGILKDVSIGDDVTISIAAHGSLSGRVTTSDGRVPERFTLVIWEEAVDRAETFYKTDGRWVLRDLSPGELTLSCSSPYGTAAKTVRVEQGQQAEVNLELIELATVSGRMVDLATGKPIGGMSVHVRPIESQNALKSLASNASMPSTGADGTFVVRSVPAGRMRVSSLGRAVGHTYDAGWRTITVEPGQNYDLGDWLIVVREGDDDEDRWGTLGFDVGERWDDNEQTPVVQNVYPGGPAERAGLRPKDVIETVDGHDVTGNRAYLYSSLTTVEPGQTVTIGLERGVELAITAEGRAARTPATP